MIRLGLIGKDISHSKSKEVYENILSQKIDYLLFDFLREDDILNLSTLFQKVQGLSITSPYKRHFISQVIMDLEIKNLGAINCIRFDGKNYFATNTDYLAVLNILNGFLARFNEIEWCILGDGSMASIFKQALDKNNQHYVQYSRKKNGRLDNLRIVSKEFNSRLVVVNTCSRNFVFQGEMPAGSIFWDCNYNMAIQKNFFQNSQIEYHDGMELLRLQASYALAFWGISISGSDLIK